MSVSENRPFDLNGKKIIHRPVSLISIKASLSLIAESVSLASVGVEP